MKKIIVLIIVILTFITNLNAFDDISKHEGIIEKKIKKIISKMSLEEKVGQMTQITIQMVAKQHGTTTQKFDFDKDKLREAVAKYHIGSLLNVYDVALSVDEWQKLITEIQKVAIKETRLKIPILYGIDAIHGANYTTDATIFPQPINMAATFNPDLVKKEGEITAREIRACGIPWNFYPVLDVGRQQLWPRLWETYGEDVYLVTKMGESYIKGAQGDDISKSNKVAICLKHFVGYSFPFDGKDRTPAFIPDRMMKEIFLPPFEQTIKLGAQTIMVNSSEVNGIPGHSNYHLLTEVLRNEMKFKGIVVSDWQDIERLYTRDKVADSPEDAVRMAVMAGIDMSMVPLDYSFYNYLIDLVKKGKVPIKRIDEAVSRILRVKIMLGLFKNPFPDEKLKEQFATKESDETNLQAAEESIVLAKNENNLLPLSKKAKVLVTGPTANLLSVLNGGWTITWQGNEESLYPKNKPTLLKAIQEKISPEKVKYVQGVNFDDEINIDSAVQVAKDVDDIILCLGESAYCETAGNINDLELNSSQLKLAKALIKTGKPVILVMIEGRPRVINKIANDVKGILLAFLPGMDGGMAISNILFGDANPSAKLSITYPKYSDDLVHYDYKPLEIAEGNVFEPQWSFGYGLSYTNFTYSNLKLDKKNYKKGDNIKIDVDVKNTGNRRGKETVLLYLNDEYASVSRPVKQLKRFTKIDLYPGESKTVTFILNDYDLSFIGRQNKRIVEPGKFKVMIKNLESEFQLQ
jgi:beta-glucosidase